MPVNIWAVCFHLCQQPLTLTFTVICTSYILLLLLCVSVPEELGFCLSLSISCTLSELQGLWPFNCDSLTALWGPFNHLDRGRARQTSKGKGLQLLSTSRQIIYIKIITMKEAKKMIHVERAVSSTQIYLDAINIWFIISNRKNNRLTWANSPMVASTLMTTPGLGSGSLSFRMRACKGENKVVTSSYILKSSLMWMLIEMRMQWTPAFPY